MMLRRITVALVAAAAAAWVLALCSFVAGAFLADVFADEARLELRRGRR